MLPFVIKANKSLHILRTLCKEGYNRSEIDLFKYTIVLPNINYALSVYAASELDLTIVQCFLGHYFKSKYTSKRVSVYDFLERQDHKIFRKVSNNTLLSIMSRVKTVRTATILVKKLVLNLRLTLCILRTLVNHLVFKYELAM